MLESNNGELKIIFRSWAGLASHFIGSCFDIASSYLDQEYKDVNPLVSFVSSQLFIDCHLTSESVLILLMEGKEWDADILCRSILEGSFKYIYMLLGSPEEVVKKVEEYWLILPMFSDIKRSERVSFLLSKLEETERDKEWEALREQIIDETQINLIRSKYNKKQRKAMEEQWSFSGICKYFKDSKQAQLEFLSGLTYSYGASSHLLHKDADGIGMVWERRGRGHDRREAVTLGHTARIIFDICTTTKLRLSYLLQYYGKDTECINELEIKYAILFEQLNNAVKNFNKVEYPDKI